MGYLEDLLEVAGEQRGFVTIDDALALGVPAVELRKMAGRGVLERRAHGLYRIAAFSSQRHDELMEAALWADGAGVISHESGLALWGLADANPRLIHVTVPRRIRRAGGEKYGVWTAVLDPAEVDRQEGIPVTSVARSIVDAASVGTDPRLIRQAIDTAERHDHLSAAGAARLRERFSTRRAG